MVSRTMTITYLNGLVKIETIFEPSCELVRLANILDDLTVFHDNSNVISIF